jgi:hypothetical protein
MCNGSKSHNPFSINNCNGVTGVPHLTWVPPMTRMGRLLTRIFHTCCRIRGWDRRPACPGRRLADRNVKQHPAINRVFSTLIVLRIPPGQWPGGTGGSPVPPRRCEIYGLTVGRTVICQFRPIRGIRGSNRQAGGIPPLPRVVPAASTTLGQDPGQPPPPARAQNQAEKAWLVLPPAGAGARAVEKSGGKFRTPMVVRIKWPRRIEG